MVAALRYLDGPLAGELISLESDRFLIGRETDCNLRPNNERISRHHCVLRRDAYGLRVRDLGSKNGTFVNGQKTRGDIVLSDGDELQVGNLTFCVVLDMKSGLDESTPKSPDQTQHEALQQTAFLKGDTLSRSGSTFSTDFSTDKAPPPLPASSSSEEKKKEASR